MPTEIDPAWEYRAVDPDLAFLEESRVEFFRYDDGPPTNLGFRFGRGDPNREVKFRLAPGRATPTRETPPKRPCRHCGDDFQPTRRSSRFCSTRCRVAGAHPNKVLPESVPCERCGTPFKPLLSRTRFCGPACGQRGKGHAENTRDQALALLAAGLSLREVAARLGVPRSTAHRWSREARSG